MNHKSYYAIIPANVRYDKRLSPNAKLLYGEITALCNEKGFCWASNNYFAELYGASKKSVSTWISQLCEFGYIRSEIKYKNGTKQIENRLLYISTPTEEKVKGYGSNLPEPMEENFNTPMEEKVKDNNTSLNTTVNNTRDKRTIVAGSDSGSDSDLAKEVIAYLNEVTGKAFKASSAKTRELIRARSKEGFTLEDFKTVIDQKARDWRRDAKMQKYLRPPTLFGTKFESYLNEGGSRDGRKEISGRTTGSGSQYFNW